VPHRHIAATQAGSGVPRPIAAPRPITAALASLRRTAGGTEATAALAPRVVPAAEPQLEPGPTTEHAAAPPTPTASLAPPCPAAVGMASAAAPATALGPAVVLP
jgi:hypothetical protein